MLALSLGLGGLAPVSAADELVAATAPAGAPAPEAATTARPSVLILSSLRKGFPTTDAVIDSAYAALRAHHYTVQDIVVEYLDLKQAPLLLAGVTKSLKARLARNPPKVVIAVEKGALSYLQGSGQALLPPGVPVVSALGGDLGLPAGLQRMVVQLSPGLDVKQTLRLGLAAFPNTKRLMVIDEPALQQPPILPAVRAFLAGLKNPPAIEDLSVLSLEEILERVARPPPDSLVLLGNFFEDGTGRALVPVEVARRVGAAANAPVLGLYEAHVRAGLLGGSVLLAGSLGQEAGKISDALLRGNRPVEPGLHQEPVPAQPLFDWARLQRWGGDTAALPADTVWLNKPRTLWQDYPVAVAVTGVAFVVVSLLAFVLARRGRKLVLAEQALHYERSLQRESLRHKAFLTNAGDGVHVLNANNRIVEVSDSFCQMIGYTREELIGMHPAQWLEGKPDVAEHDAFLNRLRQRGKKVQMETVFRRKNGSCLDVELTVNVFRVDHEAFVFASARDITERKQAEHKLQRLVDDIGDDFVVFSHDLEGQLRYVSGAMETVFGVSKEVALQSNWTTAVDWSEEDVALAQANIMKLVNREAATVEHEMRFRHPSGQWRTIQIVEHAVWEDAGAPPQIEGVAQHITRHKAQTAALQAAEASAQAAQAQAEAANNAKSAFLAAMSHEIRTPLNAMIGSTYLLRQSALSVQQREDLQAIEASGNNLLALVNDVLDFSKIEAGELLLDPLPFALQEVISDLKTMFSQTAAKKGISLVVQPLPSDLPPVLVGDSNRLRQCLINLVGNAIKFTDHGQVELALQTDQGAAWGAGQTLRVRFVVTDSGVGMTAAQLQGLFQPFKQADASTTRRYGGTGLGLSIVKRLVELMGGTIGVDSTPGQGSQFWFELPFQAGQASLPVSGTREVTRALHVLVVEDNPQERAQLLDIANGFGWEVGEVTTGQDMVRRVLDRLATQDPIDCIVLDWRMPGMDGLAALQELKAQLPPETAMPSVIMVTAADKAALQATMGPTRPDSVLTKPIEASVLFNAVNEAVVAQGHELLPFTRISTAHGQWLQGVHVLVVDDSRLNLKIVGSILELEGAEATLVESGEEALMAMARSQLPIDLVLMDMRMPKLDGPQTTEHMRAAGYDQLPILALTAGATAEEQQRARAAGMNEFLTKPVNPERLVRVVRGHVERSRGRPLPLAPAALERATQNPEPVRAEPVHAEPGPAAAAHPATAVPQVPSNHPEGWPVLDGFDMAQAKTIFGKVDFFRQTFELFLDEYGEFVPQVRALLEAGDQEQAAKQLHRIRGGAGNYGAVQLRDTAAALELALLEGRDQTDALLEAFAQAHQRTFQAVEQWMRGQPDR